MDLLELYRAPIVLAQKLIKKWQKLRVLKLAHIQTTHTMRLQ